MKTALPMIYIVGIAFASACVVSLFTPLMIKLGRAVQILFHAEDPEESVLARERPRIVEPVATAKVIPPHA